MDEKEPIYSKYVSGNRFVKVCKRQGIGEDTNFTLAYAESDLEDDEISIPDQHEVNQNVADLLTKDDKIGKVDDFLEAICQTFSSKEDIADPYHCSAKFAMQKIHDQFKSEIWRSSMFSFQRLTDIILQKVLLHVVKAFYAAVCSCDNFVQKDDTCKDALARMIDSFALFCTTSVRIKTLRRDLIRNKLPKNLKPLVKDLPAESEFFGYDINKRISWLLSKNFALQG